MGAGDANQPVEQVIDLLVTIFSWIVLTAIAVIISGKLLAKRVRFGFRGEDRFSLNVMILNLRASGDEVSLGFLTFLASLLIVSVVGGPTAYAYFQDRTGLDVGQWNSICFISALFSLAFSFVVWLIAPLLRTRPLISEAEREQQLKALTDRPAGSGGENRDG